MDDLDRWTRVLPLGSGAYGEVHLAWDGVDGRWVALKRFTGQDELGLLRMVIESRIRVSHPHLVRTLAFRLVDDRAWLVTELARGGSLRSLIARTGRLPWGWVAEVVDQILAALTALHATGVVHRDLKPANLLLRSHGATHPHLLVGDFGIATWRTVSMTGIGAAIGTPGYLAPEYLEGQSPAPSTDLFAVGVLAAELLAGHRLIHYSNASPTIPSSWHDVVPVPPEVPQPLAAVLKRMAAPDPTHRYRDCTEAREALLSAVPPHTRGDLTTVPVPDLLAALPPQWTPQGPTTAALPTPAPPAVPTPPASTPVPVPTSSVPTSSPATPSGSTPSVAADPIAADPSTALSPPTPAQSTPPSADRTSQPDAPPASEHSQPNLVGLPIDGGPTGLILENQATIAPAGSAIPPAPPLNPTSGSSTSPPPTGSSTEPRTGSSTQPPTGSSTSPAAHESGSSTSPPTGSPTQPPGDSASPPATPLRGSPTPPATPPSGSAAFPATPPRGADTKAVQRQARRARLRRKTQQALVLVVLIILASGAGTLWWAANHRAIPGQGSAAVGGSSSQPEEPAGRWLPTVVGPCDAVDIGQERTGANGTERCQYTTTPGQDQNWVEEPPGGFPKSDPGGPFPNQPCGHDGDRRYSPVGDHMECTDGAWHVIA